MEDPSARLKQLNDRLALLEGVVAAPIVNRSHIQAVIVIVAAVALVAAITMVATINSLHAVEKNTADMLSIMQNWDAYDVQE